MPNTNNYHIYIHFGDLEESSAMAGGGNNGNGESSDGDKTAKGIQSAARKIVSYATFKSTADQLISGSLSQVELTTGAAEYEQRLQAGYSIAKQVWNAGEAIAIGAMTGGIAGAVAGLVVSGVHTAINYGFRASALNKQQALENTSIYMQEIRAGTAGRRGRE